MTTDKILIKAANTFKARAKVYKDNNHRAGAMLAAAFPDGLKLTTIQDHERFIIFNLIMVKLSRYAVNWPTGHRDSIHDTAVYAAILEAIDAGNNL